MTNSKLIIVSLAGSIIFYLIMIYSYRYANGKASVPAEKRNQYQVWVDKDGKKVKRSIGIMIIIYTVIMAYQIVGLWAGSE